MKRSSYALATTLLCAIPLASPVQAQQKTLTVGGYGGSFETLMKELLIPEFEKTHDVKIAFVPGNSTENVARLQAQKSAQELDVVLLDDGPMYQADALGACAPPVDTPVKRDVYDLARMGKNAIGIGFVATGFTYNKDWFAREGWDVPKSWRDLKDPKYDQILSIPSISNTYGLHALVMMARGAGGGEKDIDPGFAAMTEVGPNVLVFEPSAGKMSNCSNPKRSRWRSGARDGPSPWPIRASRLALPIPRTALSRCWPPVLWSKATCPRPRKTLSTICWTRGAGEVRRSHGRQAGQHDIRAAARTGRDPALWRQDPVAGDGRLGHDEPEPRGLVPALVARSRTLELSRGAGIGPAFPTPFRHGEIAWLSWN